MVRCEIIRESSFCAKAIIDEPAAGIDFVYAGS
jgi:hypothetical protein